MGQAKKEQMEQEAKLARRDSFLINNTSYQKCVECEEMFIPKDEEIICQYCWEKKINED